MTMHKTPSGPTDSPTRGPDERGGKGKQVCRTTPPSESVVASWYKNAGLLDSYSIDLSASEQSSMRVLATLTVGNPPAWQKALIAVRDAMVTPFGLKTSGTVRASRDSNERVDFFPAAWGRILEKCTGRLTRLRLAKTAAFHQSRCSRLRGWWTNWHGILMGLISANSAIPAPVCESLSQALEAAFS
jgi:Protein of unknown function (DUF2867)